MIDEKQIAQIKREIPQLLSEGIIDKNKEHIKLFVFFAETAEKSLNSARLLFKVSSDATIMKNTGFPNFDGYLWVINASYYSMFYMANAALASQGIKIRSSIGVHKIVFNTFVHYFYLTNKIAKQIVEEYQQAQQDSQELLGQEEIQNIASKKATELVEQYSSEREKRHRFTYELERTQIATRAQTSLERASNFYKEITKIIK
ncbi:MAG: hypothetical protein Q7K43_00900, partial [Candidatus Woesearchaeota archaeon]|nr:hypothetical protein [Candidatus Woesearchaeota archaeon]